jgi:toxin ParE1/3/4
MSSPKYQLQVSPQAQQDIIDILRYTGGNWGQEQLVIYSVKLDTAILTIGQHPEIGQRIPEISETHRSYLVGSHIVVYRIQDDVVAIIRLLHQRMSLTRNL